MSDATKPVACGACKWIPSDWSWHNGGAHIVCECGVSGPVVRYAECFEDCIAAWNAMWAPRVGDATKRVVIGLRDGMNEVVASPFFHSNVPNDCLFSLCVKGSDVSAALAELGLAPSPDGGDISTRSP